MTVACHDSGSDMQVVNNHAIMIRDRIEKYSVQSILKCQWMLVLDSFDKIPNSDQLSAQLLVQMPKDGCAATASLRPTVKNIASGQSCEEPIKGALLSWTERN